MTALPSQLSYAATPADSTAMVAADVRNPLASILTTVNTLITALGAGVSGQVLGLSPAATAPVFPPGYQYDKTQIVADVGSITATTEGTAATVITGGSVTYDGSTLVKVEFWAPGFSFNAVPTAATFVLLRGAVVVGQATGLGTVAGTSPEPFKIEAYDTPTAASIAYVVKAFVGANTLTVKAGAGGAGTLLPAFLRVTKA